MVLRSVMLFLASGLASLVLTGLLRRWLLWRQVIDRPNARSLHATPTPRGGGLAIALVVLAWQGWTLLDPGGREAMALFGALLAFAWLGWLDDLRPRGAAVRFGVQLAVASAVAGLLWEPTRLGAIWLPFLVFGCVWFVNLFNFMDGSDGIAGVQALAGGLGAAGLALGAGLPELAALPLVLAGASAGFLWWNWAPARIFLGDAGSYCLGGGYACLIVTIACRGLPPWPWLLLFVPFVTDATLTLLRRMLAGERWWQPHRSHVYQRLILRGASHRQVALGCLALNLVCWMPASLALRNPAYGPSIVALVYALAATIWLTLSRRLDRNPS